jgi:hypothetical protein
LNHFEIDLSQGRIQVYGSNPSSDGGKTFPALQLLASAPLSLSFGVGYVHYQIGIRAPQKYLQQFHLNSPYALYYWKDLGFDGPASAPDRVYQVPDARTVGPNGGLNLGYQIVDGSSGTAQGMYTCCAKTKVAPFALANVDLSGATGAQLTFDVQATSADMFNSSTLAVRYRLNGGPWRDLNPLPSFAQLLNQPCGACPGGGTGGGFALATSVPLSDLQAGTNTLEFTSVNASQGYPLILSNVDLLVSTTG